MDKYKLIYFEGCPNHQPAVEILESVGIEFTRICQDQLEDGDPLKNYSSPTLLKGEKILFGAEAKGGGCSMPLPSKDELIKIL